MCLCAEQWVPLPSLADTAIREQQLFYGHPADIPALTSRNPAGWTRAARLPGSFRLDK